MPSIKRRRFPTLTTFDGTSLLFQLASFAFLAICSLAHSAALCPITTVSPHQRAYRMQLLKTTMKGNLQRKARYPPRAFSPHHPSLFKVVAHRFSGVHFWFVSVLVWVASRGEVFASVQKEETGFTGLFLLMLGLVRGRASTYTLL